jgi:hypothetical protein
MVTMKHNPNPQFSKAHLASLISIILKLLTLRDKSYCIEVPLNYITSAPNFLKTYVAVQKLLVGGHTDIPTDRLVV